MFKRKQSDLRADVIDQEDCKNNNADHAILDMFKASRSVVTKHSVLYNHTISKSSAPPKSHSKTANNSLIFSTNFHSRQLSGSLADCFNSTELLDAMSLSNQKLEISAHAFPHVANNTSNESIPAYIAKFPSFFYDNVQNISKKFGGMPISYLAQQNAEELSQRRYSLLGLYGVPFSTGKWPPIKSKSNRTGTMCTGHIPFDAFLQSTPTNPLDNSIPGSLPLEIKNTLPDLELTKFYQKTMSADIEGVWLLDGANLLCVAKKLPEFREISPKVYEPTGRMCPMPKIGIQEPERLYGIFSKMKGPNKIYSFMRVINHNFFFAGPGKHVYRIDLTKLILDSEKKFLWQQQFDNLNDFEKHIRSAGLEKAHAPIFRINENDEYEPVLVWCGPNGPITGDADPNQIPIPFNMTRIASWGIFNGVESKPHEFIDGLKLLLARFKSKTREEFVKYLDNCDFNLEHYMPKEELVYMRTPGSNYLNYCDPEFADYEMYQEYIAVTQSAINKFETDPSLLHLVCETDFHSILIQEAMHDPLSYHAGEDLNPFAGEIGVVLIADQTDEHSFIITENAASYLAYLFSDPTILARWKFAVNSHWLSNSRSNKELCAQWLDVIEVQALNHAKINTFEFKMYWKNILKILDRHRPGTTSIRAADQIAINSVNDLLREVALRISSHAEINKRLEQIYLRHSDQTIKLKTTIVDSQNNNKFNMSKVKLNPT